MAVPDPFPAPTQLSAERGEAEPLGASLRPGGTNFAVYSRHASHVTLVLFNGVGQVWAQLPLEARRHRSGDVWHAFVAGVGPGTGYAWRVDSTFAGPRHGFDRTALLLDPYGKGVAGSEVWGERSAANPLRSVVCDLAYDWGDDRPPRHALADSIVYELHVRAFTRHESSGVAHPGTFAGLIERIPWLRSLGVTAVQLMPVAEFDETDNPRHNPLTGARLWNAWGYSPLAFMAPRTAYAAEATAAGALREFRDMVRALHAAGIEVILDVVYNHTGEGSLTRPPRSWRGLDRADYFVLDEHGRDLDVTGCGHTFACAKPPGARLILDSLRFWAGEMHVDGFRFDLASVLARGAHGEPLADPPLLREIAFDPVLAGCKLIAEPWDAAGLYQVGSFPHHGRFAELNGRFRDDVRDWLRGAADGPGALATRLAGSSDLYAPARTPGHSVNFLTSHDGFTLADLVSHERKHNAANGENNRDGTDDHRSWNGGAEGATHEPAVRAVRSRQARNAAVLALLARGSVLWLWGDEVLRSQGGNNNPWCQDGPAWWFDWSASERANAFTRFVRGLLTLRQETRAFRGADWFRSHGAGSVVWHGTSLGAPDWDHGGRRLVMHLLGDGHPDFLLLANGEDTSERFMLPAPSGERLWCRIVDTAAAPPEDYTPLLESRALTDPAAMTLPPRSIVVLAAR